MLEELGIQEHDHEEGVTGQEADEARAAGQRCPTKAKYGRASSMSSEPRERHGRHAAAQHRGHAGTEHTSGCGIWRTTCGRLTHLESGGFGQSLAAANSAAKPQGRARYRRQLRTWRRGPIRAVHTGAQEARHPQSQRSVGTLFKPKSPLTSSQPHSRSMRSKSPGNRRGALHPGVMVGENVVRFRSSTGTACTSTRRWARDKRRVKSLGEMPGVSCLALSAVAPIMVWRSARVSQDFWRTKPMRGEHGHK